jgi:RNA polymerase sigma-70 factor (ECF subfamily)
MGSGDEHGRMDLTAQAPRPRADAIFAAWLETHGGIVERIARAHSRDPNERDQLRQELLFQLWNSAPRFRGQSQAATWIYRVCLNTALTWRRGAHRRERRTDSDADVETMPGLAPAPDTTTERRDLLGHLYAGLQALSPGDRSLLLLQLDGLPYREIAEVTGLTENHVGVALTRARQRLAAQLKGIIRELE